MREAVARGLDGPGISPLDVMPETWAHCPGFKEEMEHRRRKLEAIKVSLRSRAEGLGFLVLGSCLMSFRFIPFSHGHGQGALPKPQGRHGTLALAK